MEVQLTGTDPYIIEKRVQRTDQMRKKQKSIAREFNNCLTFIGLGRTSSRSSLPRHNKIADSLLEYLWCLQASSFHTNISYLIYKTISFIQPLMYYRLNKDVLALFFYTIIKYLSL
jgi:hypothetical protein